MTFADLATGDHFRALTTGVIYIKRTASEYGSGQAEREPQPGDPPPRVDADGIARSITTIRGDTPVEWLHG